MKWCAGAATPCDTRYPNSMCAVFAHKCCAADAVIGDDSMIAEAVLIRSNDRTGTVSGDLLHDAETRHGRPTNYEKRQLNRLGGRNMKRDHAAATATHTPTENTRPSNAQVDAGAVAMTAVAVLCSLMMC